MLGIFLSAAPAILRKLKAGANVEIEAPGQTVGFNLESIYHKKKEYCIWVRYHVVLYEVPHIYMDYVISHLANFIIPVPSRLLQCSKCL